MHTLIKILVLSKSIVIFQKEFFDFGIAFIRNLRKSETTISKPEFNIKTPQPVRFYTQKNTTCKSLN